LQPPIIVARAASGLLAHFPDAARLAGGRILATYREGAGHVTPDGRIRVVDSPDGGLTWGPPRIAVDGPFDDRDPKVAALADGTVLLSYFVLDWRKKHRYLDRIWRNRERHRVLGTFVRRSTDGGATWDEPARAGLACSHGAAAELPGGDILIPLYGKPAGERWERATVARSTDGGRTWSPEIVVAAADGLNFQEPTLTVLDDQVVCLIRTTAGVAYLSRSTDGGHHWTAPVPTDMPASSHHALALSTGEVLVTYGDLSPRYSPHRETVGRLIHRPAGTWDGHPDVQIYDSNHQDQANPSSVEVTPGRFLTLGFDVREGTVIGVFTEPRDYSPLP
jgi:hypothetical protein